MSSTIAPPGAKSPSTSDSSSSADEFSDLDDHPTTVPKLTLPDLERDSDVELLETAVFGQHTLRDSLVKKDSSAPLKPSKSVVSGASTQELVTLPDDALFALDTVVDCKPAKRPKSSSGQAEKPGNSGKPVWEDSDDERMAVSLTSRGMLRKLRKFEGEDLISGSEYRKRLDEHYKTLHPEPQWLQQARAVATTKRSADGDDRPSKRRRRLSDSSDDSSASEDGQPLTKLLGNIQRMQQNSQRASFRPEILNVQRSRNFVDEHSCAITSLQFHPSKPKILLSTSLSSTLRIHRLDPAMQPTPNPTITTVQLSKITIRRAAFAVGTPGGDRIFVAGRAPHIFNWNLETGITQRTCKVTGHVTRVHHRSFEYFRPSPTGEHLAVLGSKQNTISILHAASMMWVSEAHLLAYRTISDFVWWRNGEGMTVLAKDGTIGEYSMEQGAFVAVFTDSGSVGSTVLALGGSDGPALLGTDRWLATGDSTGFVHVYDRNAVYPKVTHTKKGDDLVVEIGGGVKSANPEPQRRLENMTTAITTLAFSPCGQLLVAASDKKRNALKVVHLPTCTYYRNWPTDLVPLGRVTAVVISEEGFLVIGNDIGRLVVFELRT